MINTPRGYERFSTLSGQQQDIYDTLLSKLKGQLGGEGMDTFKAPYLREFEEKIIPGLAERFAGMGAGSQSSSAFEQALGSSGADLSEREAAFCLCQTRGWAGVDDGGGSGISAAVAAVR